MSTPTPKPSSADLRQSARVINRSVYAVSFSRVREELIAGADAIDQLATVTAQRDRLAHRLEQCVEALDALDNGLDLDPGLIRVRIRDARAALAELEGGAS